MARRSTRTRPAAAAETKPATPAPAAQLPLGPPEPATAPPVIDTLAELMAEAEALTATAEPARATEPDDEPAAAKPEAKRSYRAAEFGALPRRTLFRERRPGEEA